MKAAYLTGIRQVELREAPPPVLRQPDDVLLRVEVVGVCGSDMHYYRNGRIGSQVVRFPWTVGHECAGIVLAAGPAVRRVRPGDRVAVDPLIWCGQCDQCLAGRMHTCRKQAFLGCPGQAPGALAEQIVMPERCVFAVPPEMDAVTATLLEPFSIGLYAWNLVIGQTRPRNVAILGSGPIGLSVLAAARATARTASNAAGETVQPPKIFVTDIRDNRLAVARTFGADWTGNPRNQDVVADIASATPLGLDAVFECAGEQETIDQAQQLLAPGGVLAMVGIPEVDRMAISADLMRRRELRIQNVRRQNESIEPAIALVTAGHANLAPMVTHHFDLSQTATAFDTVADYRDNVLKAMIHVTP